MECGSLLPLLSVARAACCPAGGMPQQAAASLSGSKLPHFLRFARRGVRLQKIDERLIGMMDMTAQPAPQ